MQVQLHIHNYKCISRSSIKTRQAFIRARWKLSCKDDDDAN